jgi:hypothetical protein
VLKPSKQISAESIYLKSATSIQRQISHPFQHSLVCVNNNISKTSSNTSNGVPLSCTLENLSLRNAGIESLDDSSNRSATLPHPVSSMASHKSTSDGPTKAEVVMEVTKMKALIAAQQEEIARDKKQIEQNEWTDSSINKTMARSLFVLFAKTRQDPCLSCLPRQGKIKTRSMLSLNKQDKE